MYTVKKTFWFEAAHRLLITATAGCKRLHGHSYKVIVTIERPALGPDAMVLDFTLFSAFVKDTILPYLDHKTLLSSQDPLTEVLDKECVQLIDPQPTAEVLCRWVFDRIQLNVEGVSSVEIWETENSSAVYRKGE